MTESHSPQTPESRRIPAAGAVALAILLYALLADAAIETLAGGSPVRWWVGAIVMVYGAASVVLWRLMPRLWNRLGWRGRAAASFFVLLGLLAFTAWLPGGQAAGIVLIAQPTARVFATVTTAAVLVSALVLLRALKWTPLWARAAVVALAAYGLGAFTIGIARHTAYSELLRASAWTGAPFWLQGAFLGVFLVVPLAVVAESIAVGRSLAAGSAWSAQMSRIVALAASVLMAVPAVTLSRSAPVVPPAGAVKGSAAGEGLAFVAAGQLPQAAAEHLVNEPPGMPEGDPAHFLEVAGAAVGRFRPTEWELDALGASLGKDPAAAFEIVRDAIAFDPYAGVLRGARGTLAARGGNAWDRALLLRALLDRSGFRTRLAFASLDGETTRRLVARAHRRPAHRLSAGSPAGLLAHVGAAVASRARRDDAALRLALGGRLDELGAEDEELTRQDVSGHAWVQLLQGDTWLDLDPTLPDAQMGKALTVATSTAADVPPDRRHAVVARVIAETLANGKLSETVSLQRVLPAVAAAEQYLLLAFLPDESRGGGRLMGSQSSPKSFVPTLWVGDQAQTGRPIALKATGGGVGFDSLFGGGEEPARELAGLFIEIETRAPGRRPIVARHVLLDRVPPDARSSSIVRAEGLEPMVPDGVPRAFTGFHHLMISTGGTSPLDMARLRLAALETALSPDGPAPQQERKNSPAWPLWASDLTLVEGSERLVVDAVDSTGRGRAYVGEPRVFLGSWFPEATEAVGLSRETDLLIDSVRVLLPGPGSAREASERQLQYGALQSALETETALQLAAAWDPADREIVSTSLAMGGRLTVLAPADVERLPAGSARALAKALRAGDLAVVPGDPSTARAWWTIARSGFARAIVEPGAGMSGIGKVSPASPGTGTGGRHPGQRGGSGNRGKEYTELVQQVAVKTARTVDTFERFDAAKAARLAKLLAGR